MSEAELDSEFTDIASLNIKWIRFDIAWPNVQSKMNADYDWTIPDRIISAANAHHLNVLAILDYTPTWARRKDCTGTLHCLPADPTQFATFAKAAVTRYAPKGVSAWEIWNEPNLRGALLPATDASAYANLLKLTYVAIKSVQPTPISTVISGGLGPTATGNGNITPIQFLTELYAAGAKDYFDAVGFHPYSSPALPSFRANWNAWQQMGETNPSLRSVMAANGDGDKKIWMTEYGAPTGGPGVLEASTTDITFASHPDHVTETLQAVMFMEAIAKSERYPWAGPLFWYSYKDIGTSITTTENFFGLLRFDGSRKPAYTVIKKIL